MKKRYPDKKYGVYVVTDEGQRFRKFTGSIRNDQSAEDSQYS